MQYRVTVDFSYELDSEKDHEELQKYLEQNLNELTKGVVLDKRQIRLKKMKEPKSKTRITTLDPKKFLSLVTKDNKVQDFTVGDKVYTARMDSSRFFVFKKSSACAACGLEASKVILEINPNDKSPHFNLYAEENGKLILMTKDHIKAVSKGGKNEIENYATCCTVCNNLKGNYDLTYGQVGLLRECYNKEKNLPRKKLKEKIETMRQQFIQQNLSDLVSNDNNNDCKNSL